MYSMGDYDLIPGSGPGQALSILKILLILSTNPLQITATAMRQTNETNIFRRSTGVNANASDRINTI
jgi:hypothetical protein